MSAFTRTFPGPAEAGHYVLSVPSSGLVFEKEPDIGRVPGTVEALPLPVNGAQELESVRQVLRNRDLESAVMHLAPGIVGDAVQQRPARIDTPEPAKRLIRPGGIDAVDVDLGVLLLVDLHDAGHVHACLPRELPPEAERELIEQVYNPASFLTYTNPQTPRAVQLDAVVRF